MTPPTPLIFFIHGLNTYGDDNARVGPLNLGPMVQAWGPALKDTGAVYALNEMGFGPIDHQVDRAMKQIRRTLATEEGPVYLFGHSMGGLVARGLAKRMATEFPARVKSVITIGSPHFGARAADRALTFHERSPRLYQLMKFFGYDSKDKLEQVKPLTTIEVEEFNSRHPLLSDVENVSLIGAAPKEHLGLQYRAIHGELHEHPTEQSDGLVISASQRWGRIAGEFQLDHFGLLGIFKLLPPNRRPMARQEFARAVKTVQDIIKSNS